MAILYLKALLLLSYCFCMFFCCRITLLYWAFWGCPRLRAVGVSEGNPILDMTSQPACRNTQGKCIVNGLSVASSEEEFLRAAEECRRFGAAVIVLALPKHEGGYPTYQEKAGVTQSTGHFESRFFIYLFNSYESCIWTHLLLMLFVWSWLFHTS